MGKGGPGTLDVTKSTPRSIEPKMPVVTSGGRRLSRPAMGSVRARAGSARARPTRSRTTFIRWTGSFTVRGTAKRAGANWLPARCSVAAVRTLIGIDMRRADAGSPWRSW